MMLQGHRTEPKRQLGLTVLLLTSLLTSFFTLHLVAELRLVSCSIRSSTAGRTIAQGCALAGRSITLHFSLFTLNIPGFRKHNVSQKGMIGENRDRLGGAGTRANHPTLGLGCPKTSFNPYIP